jgi:predicted DNA binding CopG/RHH family protein
MEPIFNLTPEEQEIEDELETGDFVSVSASNADKAEWAAMARHTLEKTKAINIRLTEKSLIKVKAAAAREGLSYQTFISSLIHKNT